MLFHMARSLRASMDDFDRRAPGTKPSVSPDSRVATPYPLLGECLDAPCKFSINLLQKLLEFIRLQTSSRPSSLCAQDTGFTIEVPLTTPSSFLQVTEQGSERKSSSRSAQTDIQLLGGVLLNYPLSQELQKCVQHARRVGVKEKGR